MTTTRAAIVFFLFPMAFGYAQSQDTLHLWPNKVPNEVHPKSTPVQTPDTSRAVIRITEITNPKLTIFKPKKGKGNHGAIIIAPGGGYQYLAINIEGSEIAEWLNMLGYTAFVLEYRTPNNRLGALNDIQRAIRMVRNKAKDFDLHANKIGVMGFSAGGNLSLLASTNYLQDSYKKQDDIDLESCRPDFTILMYPYYVKNDPQASVLTEVQFHKGMPPMFLFGTFDDFLVEGFFDIAKSIKEMGTPLQMHLYERGGHGYGLRVGNPAAEQWPPLVENWLQQVFQE
ncbi:alpha/beta hydrolase [Flagellimonas pelagia]|uniref:Alpha/beta hydrolase n=1 Tax=Flagellimonas pelagia TaxID=2306998 RepID=A0A3A1NPP0_9FLAO|nr:alpha/beta hydrolase [Allomuricauda maritima]RIV46422.1 alpha/beta hydrolase [Allomuricauda maritima]TXJ99083.1 alpha/beta hydrolase [Allomuricauda maritima]